MTSSRSIASTSRLLQVAAAVLVGWFVFAPAFAEAGRRRVVVRDFDGPKAEKFHEGVVKAIKKSHTVVPLDKWNETAEELNASKRNEKNFKKVAKKLKVDAIIEGKIDKRRDNYIVKLKIRAGGSGELVGNPVDVTTDGPRVDATAQRDLKDELVEQISALDANRGSGGGGDDEEEEERPKKVAKKVVEEEEEEEEEEDVKPKKKGFSRKDDEETAAALKTKKSKDDEEDPLPKPRKAVAKKVEKEDVEEEEEEEERPKKKKKVASRDDEEEDGEEEGIEEEADVEGLEGAAALSPGERAIDAVIGLSFNARRLSWNTEAMLGNKPPPYKGVPVAGALIDATFYPLAIGHKRRGMAKNLGATVMYDKVLKINSRAGNPPVDLPTSQARWAVGAVFRYPLGAKAMIGAAVRFGKQSFEIQGAGGVTPGIPNVTYTIIDPMAMLRFQVAPKLTFNVNLGFMAITNTGQIQEGTQYGAATVSGFEGEIGGDYLLTKNIFARAAFRFATIGFSFKGGAMQTNMRDTDNAQDVFGARDTYLGGAVSVGYLY